MKIVIGCDHAGYELKEICKSVLENSGDYAIVDFGVYNTESSDYPDVAHEVAASVSKGEHEMGILVCGSGMGMSIAANRHKGVRAALCHSIFSAKMITTRVRPFKFSPKALQQGLKNLGNFPFNAANNLQNSAVWDSANWMKGSLSTCLSSGI